MCRKLLYSQFWLVCFSVLVLVFFAACGDVANPGGGFIVPDEIPVAKIELDQLAYSGYCTPARLIVRDTNNSNLSIPIVVTSLADPVGVTIHLSNSGSNFVGYLWFTNSNSVAGQTIKATNNDTLRLVYDQPEPSGRRVRYTQWFSTLFFGVYLFSPQILEFGVNTDYGDIYQAQHLTGGTINTRSGAIHVMSNAWRSYKLNNPINLGIFSQGYLVMVAQATNNIDIKLEWGKYGDAVSVGLADYISMDTNLHYVRIPVSDFKNLDMTQFKAFTFSWNGLSEATFVLDEVRFEN